ncbi:hypothetical protein D3C72_1051440 [compost metagenome]
MPTPIVYPPYMLPTAALYGAPAVGRVSPATGPAPIAPFDGDPPPDASTTDRYWAGVSAAAGARTAPVARREGPTAVAPARTTIAQRDTLSLHAVAQQDNPFEGLIEHVLHVRLPKDEAP